MAEFKFNESRRSADQSDGSRKKHDREKKREALNGTVQDLMNSMTKRQRSKHSDDLTTS